MLHVLVVDDEKLARGRLRTLVAECTEPRAEVTAEAASATEAMALLASQRFDVALRLGVTQQTVSALERNAEAVSAERLMRLLNILGVEWVLRTRSASPSDLPAPGDGAHW